MRYLYRYLKFKREGKRLKDWKDKRLARIFSHNEVYFISPKDFNDPFDCKTLFTFRDSSDGDFKRFFEGKIKNDFPNLSKKAISKRADAYLKKGFHKDPAWGRDHIERWLRIQISENLKLGMLCLSKKRDDILMWSHYADGHTGFCLQFDKAVLHNWQYCDFIRYGKFYPTFKEFVRSPHNLHSLFLFRKSEHRKYEREWRVIVNVQDPANRILRFPDHLLTGVILGCQMPDYNKALIHHWIESRRVRPKLYQAEPKKNGYALKIVGIK